MDIAVMSDIHSNHVAFERCLSYALARKIGVFFFLGDYVGDMAYPQKTMDLLYEMEKQYQCFFVRGNREDYLLDYQKGGEKGWKIWSFSKTFRRYAGFPARTFPKRCRLLPSATDRPGR